MKTLKLFRDVILLCNRVISEAEKWIIELGYQKIVIESRIVATDFYKKNGYEITDSTIIKSGVFECIRMEKCLKNFC